MERIGFIGLGIMGKPMAHNLIKAGHSLVVHNRSRDAVVELAGRGAVEAGSPREVAEQCRVLITMLPDSPDVDQVVFGREGVFEGIGQGMLFVDMSTIAPATSRRIYEQMSTKGAEALDAPVSGGEVGAVEGTQTGLTPDMQESLRRLGYQVDEPPEAENDQTSND